LSVGIRLSDHQKVLGSTSVVRKNSVRTPANSVFRQVLSVGVVRIPSNLFPAQKAFMQGPRKSSKPSLSFEVMFFPAGQPSHYTPKHDSLR